MPKHHIHHALHHNLTTFSPPQKRLNSPKPPTISTLHHAGFNFLPQFPHIPPSRDIKVCSNSRTLVFVQRRTGTMARAVSSMGVGINFNPTKPAKSARNRKKQGSSA